MAYPPLIWENFNQSIYATMINTPKYVSLNHQKKIKSDFKMVDDSLVALE